MGRLVRCIEGHIFEAEKGPRCPFCGAPTSFAIDEAAPEEVSPRPPPAVIEAAPKPAAGPRLALVQAAAAQALRIIAGIGSLGALVAARRKSMAYAAGAIGILALAAVAYLKWTAAAPIMPLPPPADAFAVRDPHEREALDRRLDQILAAGPSDPVDTIRLPDDRDGQAMAALRLSPELVTALGGANGWYLASEGNVKDGLALLARAARRGSVSAFARLGEFLAKAPQQPNDLSVALDASLYAGSAGIGAAHYRAASLLGGKMRDLPGADKLAKKETALGAQLGDPEAIKSLSKNGQQRVDEEGALVAAYLRDRATGLASLAAAAQRGWPRAAYELGNDMLGVTAPKGLQTDASVGLRWLRFAADRDSIDAMQRLSLAYAKGNGVAPNPAEAFLWLYLALADSEWAAPHPNESDLGGIKAVLLGQVAELNPMQKRLIRKLVPPGQHPAAFVTHALGPLPFAAKAAGAPIALPRSSLPKTDLLVMIGQPVKEVQTAYKLAGPLSPFGLDFNKTMLSAPQQGLTFFFDQNGQLETIRVDKPFQGHVVGIAIGDPFAKVKAAFGEPISTFPFSGRMANVYRETRWSSSVRFDVGADGSVATIFVKK